VEVSIGGDRIVYKGQAQSVSPVFLFGTAATATSSKVLPNGRYYLSAKGAPEWGRVQFTQNCPCPNGKVGKKGCMTKKA
jgi:hypothetical protein